MAKVSVEPKEIFPFSKEQLLESYKVGRLPNMFPDGTYHLYAPEMRAVLDKPQMHVSKTVLQFIRQERYAVQFDKNFEAVIRNCIRPDYRWITEEVINVYKDLHDLGYVHSAEATAGGALVGGLYGVAIGKVFFIESMFTKANNASKVALFYLLKELDRQEFRFVDLQFLTPHLASIGGIEISNAEFQARLAECIPLKTDWGTPSRNAD